MDLISGTDLNLALQQGPDWLTIPMQLVSLLGTTEIYLLIITTVYWCYDTRLGLRLALVTAMSGWANDILKLSMQLPRPSWVNSQVQMLNLKPELSFGFPSGHAQMTLPFYGMIGYWVRSWKFLAVICILILTIGISRLYLGVHFPLDVLGGWLFGLIMLVAIILLDKPVSDRIAEWSTLKIICTGLVLSVLLVVITILVSAGNSGFSIPPGWIGVDHAVIPNSVLFSLKNSLMTSGFLFGIITGGACVRRLSFNATGRWVIRGGRYLVGLTGVALIWIVFGVMSHDMSGHAGDLLTWVLGVFLGIWILYGAPWLFISVGLNGEPNGN
nr:phosphatase PAP2 family protein [uncultured Methanospirillum sp.]